MVSNDLSCLKYDHVIYRESAQWMKLYYDRLQNLHSAICRKTLTGQCRRRYFIYLFFFKSN